jgi:hypothetical protein
MTMSSEDEGTPKAAKKDLDDAVGFKRPPKQFQYTKGQSGNWLGRPRKARSNEAIARKVLLEKRKADIAGNGKARYWTTLEFTVVRLRQLALEGNTRAHKMYNSYEAQYGEQESKSKGGVVIIPTVPDFETWVRLFGPKD